MVAALIPIMIALASAAGGWAANKWGSKEEPIQQVPTVLPEQLEALKEQLGLTGPAAQSALQHYQNLLANNPEAFAAFEAPAMRQFNEQIVPNIAERFSAVGGQRSSAFPQALSQSAADLSERLAAMRANLQNEASRGILGYMNTLFGQRPFENVEMQESPGFFSGLLPAIGQGVGEQFASPDYWKTVGTAVQSLTKARTPGSSTAGGGASQQGGYPQSASQALGFQPRFRPTSFYGAL